MPCPVQGVACFESQGLYRVTIFQGQLVQGFRTKSAFKYEILIFHAGDSSRENSFKEQLNKI